jgi:predicted Zn finger-like uncharacterized protein
MKITCQSCQARYTIADEKVAGKTVKIMCRKCGAAIVVSGANAPMTAAPATPDQEGENRISLTELMAWTGAWASGSVTPKVGGRDKEDSGIIDLKALAAAGDGATRIFAKDGEPDGPAVASKMPAPVPAGKPTVPDPEAPPVEQSGSPDWPELDRIGSPYRAPHISLRSSNKTMRSEPSNNLTSLRPRLRHRLIPNAALLFFVAVLLGFASTIGALIESQKSTPNEYILNGGITGALAVLTCSFGAAAYACDFNARFRSKMHIDADRALDTLAFLQGLSRTIGLGWMSTVGSDGESDEDADVSGNTCVDWDTILERARSEQQDHDGRE